MLLAFTVHQIRLLLLTRSFRKQPGTRQGKLTHDDIVAKVGQHWQRSNGWLDEMIVVVDSKEWNHGCCKGSIGFLRHATRAKDRANKALPAFQRIEK